MVYDLVDREGLFSNLCASWLTCTSGGPTRTASVQGVDLGPQDQAFCDFRRRSASMATPLTAMRANEEGSGTCSGSTSV